MAAPSILNLSLSSYLRALRMVALCPLRISSSSSSRIALIQPGNRVMADMKMMEKEVNPMMRRGSRCHHT